MNIRERISYIIKKYKTSDPFELATALGIQIIEEDLGSIKGYYNNQFRIKQIHINSALDEHMKVFTCAHELGHALLHPNANTPFLRTNTLLSVDALEIEANKFAVNLLISDYALEENKNLTIDQLSRLFGHSVELMELRLR